MTAQPTPRSSMTDATTRPSVDAGVSRATMVLASLPAMYPRRLREIVRFHRADEALSLLGAARRLHPSLESSRHAAALDALRVQARAIDAVAVIESHEAAGIRAVVRGQPDYPTVLDVDPDAPEILFARGDLACLDRRRVGIVGTRNATAAGRATARQLGRELGLAGVSVVSGLARGIDAAAHLGVNEARVRPGEPLPTTDSLGTDSCGTGSCGTGSCGTGSYGIGAGAPIAVVGSGLDVVYPRANRVLWEAVAERGLMLSEWPIGSPPEAWHFPLRNRIIAALSEVLVVVESRESGGSLITAHLAAERGVDVMAVPGSTHCRAAAGTNRLIADGAGVVCGVDDVLTALDLHHGMTGQQRLDLWGDRSQAGADGAPMTGPSELFARLDPGIRDAAAAVFDICRDRPATLDQLVQGTGSGLLTVARAVAKLEHCGLLRDSNGWFESEYSRIQANASPSLE